jgi:hypothetical protein
MESNGNGGRKDLKPKIFFSRDGDRRLALLDPNNNMHGTDAAFVIGFAQKRHIKNAYFLSRVTKLCKR